MEERGTQNCLSERAGRYKEAVATAIQTHRRRRSRVNGYNGGVGMHAGG